MTALSTTGWHGSVTIVVPTYNERDNVGPLIERLAAVLPAERAEIIVVDDSSDDTPDAVLAAAERVSIPVRLVHRLPEQRVGGLGGAVLCGLAEATGDWVVVMDGDLQHPPETVPRLLAAKERGVDAVVASRYRAGGSAAGLTGGYRRWGSSGAGTLAKLLFPRKLRDCTDPMSGFFAVRRAALDKVELRPDGFKILLEILARTAGLRVAEVPFSFADRHAGDSKAGARQALIYLRHLTRLRTSGKPGRLAGFLAVGATGLIPNLAAMYALQRAGVHYLPATVIATVLAMSWNFGLSDGLLFRHRRSGRLRTRYVSYLGLNVIDIVLRLPMMAVLVGGFGMPVLLATVVSTIAVSAVRFAVLDRFLYRARVRPAQPTRSAAAAELPAVLDVQDAAA